MTIEKLLLRFINNTVLIFFVVLLFANKGNAQVTKGGADAHFNDENYRVALKQYKKLLRSDKENAFYHERLGLCYLYSDDDKTEAIPYLEYVDTLPDTERIIHFELGVAYFHDHQFSKARKYLKEFLKKPGEQRDSSIIYSAIRHLEYISNAEQFMKAPKDVTYINLQEEVNSKYSEYYPFVSTDEKIMVFTTDKRYISDFEEYIPNIYYSKFMFGNWQKAKSTGSKVNTDEAERIVGLNKAGNAMLIYANTLDYSHDILISRRIKGRFREPVSVGKNVNGPLIEMGAALSKNEDTLYFASDIDGGYGGFDLYYALRLPDGDYGIPINMGETINTEYDDNFPNFGPDEKILYFASKGRNSMGGYDIFYTSWDIKSKQWLPPRNMGYPINNTRDNEIISMLNDQRYGYISDFKPDGVGDRDLYKVIFNEIEAERIIYTGVIAIGDSLNPISLPDTTTITLKVYREDSKDLFGMYSCHKTSKRYAIALPPGKFDIIIEDQNYAPYKESIEVFEKYYEEKVFNHNIYIQQK